MVAVSTLEYGRVILAVLLVVANFVVWAGVYLEKDTFSQKTKDFGWRMLVSALAAEAALAAILVFIDTVVSIEQKREIASLEEKLLEAKVQYSDRFLFGEDTGKFLGIMRNGVTLHMFVLTGDHEAERFARSIRQALWSNPTRQGKIIISSFTEDEIQSGLLPGGIFGPFGGDQNDRLLQGSSIKLMQAFMMLGFCIYPREVTPSMKALDPSPSSISLIIGPKDRQATYCK